jgi:hypothetical protein
LDFLGAPPSRDERPVYEGWILLDFLGLSRPNRDLSMGYTAKSAENFSLALFPDVGCTIRVLQVEATRKRQEYSCRKRNLVSGFLQDNILRGAR